MKRLNAANFLSFHWIWRQTWGFLQENDITRGILEDLVQRFPKTEAAAEETLQSHRIKVGDTESGNVAICYWLLRKCASRTDFDYLQNLGSRLAGMGTNLRSQGLDQCVDLFRKTYVEPLFDYLDEQIEGKHLTLTLLRKYKHRCEWFRREQMLDTWKENTKQGEKLLVSDLYEYLHDQGVQFHIEPQSDSGRIDLISNQSGKDRLLADAKIFNADGSQDRGYIVKGFRQLYDYIKDYHETFGYLVIFKTCEEDLSIPTAQQESGIPFVCHNNKTIFILVIDVCRYTESASKRGKLKVHEILPSQFIESLSDGAT